MMVQTTSQHYTLDLLADGVFVAMANVGGAAIGNAGLVDLGDSTLVIDSFLTPTAAEDLREDANHLTGRFPGKVINTHYHNDHIWGNQAFLPEADIISTIETRRLIQSAGQEEYEYYRSISDERLKKLLDEQARQKSSLGAGHTTPNAFLELMIGFFSGLVHDFPRLIVTLPNLVFDNKMVLYGSRRRAELISFSGAHTGSDTVVYLPDDGILFMSDLLFIGYHAYLGDGNPDRWKEVLFSILDGSSGIQNVRQFVPGHGPTGTQADVQQLVGYIQACQAIAQTLAAKGKLEPGDASIETIPAAYAGWSLPVFFQANLRFLLKQSAVAIQDPEPDKTNRASNSFRP